MCRLATLPPFPPFTFGTIPERNVSPFSDNKFATGEIVSLDFGYLSSDFIGTLPTTIDKFTMSNNLYQNDQVTDKSTTASWSTTGTSTLLDLDQDSEMTTISNKELHQITSQITKIIEDSTTYKSTATIEGQSTDQNSKSSGASTTLSFENTTEDDLVWFDPEDEVKYEDESQMDEESETGYEIDVVDLDSGETNIYNAAEDEKADEETSKSEISTEKLPDSTPKQSIKNLFPPPSRDTGLNIQISVDTKSTLPRHQTVCRHAVNINRCLSKRQFLENNHKNYHKRRLSQMYSDKKLSKRNIASDSWSNWFKI